MCIYIYMYLYIYIYCISIYIYIVYIYILCIYICKYMYIYIYVYIYICIYTFIYRYKSHKFEMRQQESLHPCASTGSQDQLDWPGASQRSCCSLLCLKCCVQTLARKEEVERPKEKDQLRRINKGTKSGTFLDYHILEKKNTFLWNPSCHHPERPVMGEPCLFASWFQNIERSPGGATAPGAAGSWWSQLTSRSVTAISKSILPIYINKEKNII